MTRGKPRRTFQSSVSPQNGDSSGYQYRAKRRILGRQALVQNFLIPRIPVTDALCGVDIFLTTVGRPTGSAICRHVRAHRCANAP